MKLRQRLKLGATALPVLVLVAFALYRWDLSRRVDAALEEIRDQGCPVTLEELNAWYVEPPEGENAAEVYLSAPPSLALPADPQALPMEGGRPRLHRSEPLYPEMKEATLAYLMANRATLDVLHEAAPMRASRWAVDFADASGRIPHLKWALSASELLALEALLLGTNGQGVEAGQSIAAGLALARSLAPEPAIFSQSIRTRGLDIAVKALERVLNDTALSGETLTALSQDLRDADNAQFLTRALAGERCGLAAMAREGAMGVRGFLPVDSALETAFMSVVYGPSGLAERDFLLYLGLMDEAIRLFEEPEPLRLGKANQLMARIDQIPWCCPLSRSLTRYVPGLVPSWARNAANLRTARLALAVERYRAKTGELPESDAALIPGFIDASPVDPFTGNPIRYSRLPGGYVTYSVSQNGIDDGGIESRKPRRMLHEGDLTFTVERE